MKKLLGWAVIVMMLVGLVACQGCSQTTVNGGGATSGSPTNTNTNNPNQPTNSPTITTTETEPAPTGGQTGQL